MAFNGDDGTIKNYNSSELTNLFGSKILNDVLKKNKTGSNLFVSISVKLSLIKSNVSICFGVNKCDIITPNEIHSNVNKDGIYSLCAHIPTNCYLKVVVLGDCFVEYINAVAMGT